jgi:hypothetical protein
MDKRNQSLGPRLFVSGFFCAFFLFSGSIAFAGWSGLIQPEVSRDWSLSRVSLTSPFEGWAVGKDADGGTGVLVQYHEGSLLQAPVPAVSGGWSLSDVHLLSSEEGWAVGEDSEGRKGVLLHYQNPDWTSVSPPAVSLSWSLEGVHFSSPGTGWAVGSDVIARSGVLLGYADGLWTKAAPPPVSADWRLFGVHFPVSSEGWAVGEDRENGRGVLLHFAEGFWQPVTAPEVSSDWGLKAVQFPSTDEGWAVGGDQANDMGVILHYADGIWQAIIPPSVSQAWSLEGVHFASTREGWASGTNRFENKGVLLHYLEGVWSVVDPPGIGSDWGLSGVQFFSPYFGLSVGENRDGGSGVVLQFLLATPRIEAVPNVVDFGNVLLGSFDEEEIIVRNLGFSDLILFSIAGEIDSPFKNIAGDCVDGMILASGESCNMIVQFTPTESGTFADGIVILSNDPTEPELLIPIRGGSGPDLFGQWEEFSQDCKAKRDEIQCKIRAIFEIQNVGNLQASPFTVKLYLSDEPILTDEDTPSVKTRISKLKPAGVKDVKFKFNLEKGETATGKYLIGIIDTNGDVQEANETNNISVFGPIP